MPPAIDAAGLPALPEVANVLAEIAIASAAAAGLRQLLGFRAARKTKHGAAPRGFTVVPDGGAIGVLTSDSFLRITRVRLRAASFPSSNSSKTLWRRTGVASEAAVRRCMQCVLVSPCTFVPSS